MSDKQQSTSYLISDFALKYLPDLIPSSVLENLFNVSKGFWAKKRVEGYGPRFIKVGSRVLYPKEEVITWINENLITSTSEE